MHPLVRGLGFHQHTLWKSHKFCWEFERHLLSLPSLSETSFPGINFARR